MEWKQFMKYIEAGNKIRLSMEVIINAKER